MTTTPAEQLARTLRAVIGAARAHDFDVFWPYSPASCSIAFERAVSHGRGRPRTYDQLVLSIDPSSERVERVKLVVGGASSAADTSRDDRHPFDVVDELLVGIYGA